MSAIKEIRVPDIGDFSNVAVIDVPVKDGDTVRAEETLITLESEKATVDIPAPYGGKIKTLRVKVGDKVSEGSVILTMETQESVAVPASAAAIPAPGDEEIPPAGNREPAPPEATKTHASPSVRAFARELGVNLAQVNGSGMKRRILKEDVQAYVKSELSKPRGGVGLTVSAMPAVDFAKFGEIEIKPLHKIKKLSGANLHRNWVTAPHVTQHDDADITDLEHFRQAMNDEAKQQGVRLTLPAFLIKAVAAALKAYPDFNASLTDDGEALVMKRYFHIGLAVDTPEGLMVPVIRDADKKGLIDINRELGELSARARTRKILPAEMQGGCFSISSLGGIGGTYFTPIVNLPEVAVLGVSRAIQKPVWNGKEFIPRLMMPLSLSYDHRVIDGAQGARFVTYLGRLLADVRRLLL